MTMRLATPWPGCQIRTGTMVATVSSDDAVRMWTPAEFAAKFGRVFDGAKDCVCVMNADGKANNAHVDGATWIDGDGLYAVFDRTVNGNIRINWLVALAP